MIDICLQTDADTPAIESLMAEAFGPSRHERSVWNLRPGPPVASLCLVIRDEDEVVGSLRYWEVQLGRDIILLLGPLAVRPVMRGRGYGKQLIAESLRLARQGPWKLVLVSGEVDYYPKFGFVPAAPYGVAWPGFIEPERLQFLELVDGALDALPCGSLTVRPRGEQSCL